MAAGSGGWTPHITFMHKRSAAAHGRGVSILSALPLGSPLGFNAD